MIVACSVTAKLWGAASAMFLDFTRARGSRQLLAMLAVGKFDRCPFDGDSTPSLKTTTILEVESRGFYFAERPTAPKTCVVFPISGRGTLMIPKPLKETLRSVRVGTGARLPRLRVPVLESRKKKWSLAEFADPADHREAV